MLVEKQRERERERERRRRDITASRNNARSDVERAEMITISKFRAESVRVSRRGNARVYINLEIKCT